MKSRMKKLTALSAAAILAVSALAGCGGGSSSSAPASTAAADEGQVYRIGICQLVQHEALDRATAGFQDALVELLGEDHIEFDLQNAQGDSNTCATIANGFVSDNKDLIMANATASLQACSNATSEIPVVATAITSFPSALDIEMGTGPDALTGINVTGTNDLSPLDLQAQQIKDLFPDVQNVGILYCSAEVNSVFQAVHIGEYLDALNIAHQDFTFSDSNDLQSVVQDAVTKCDVLYIPTDNTAASNAGLIDSVARPAQVPIITGEESPCKICGLASVSIDFYEIGYRAGEMAYDILVNGADPATMPVEDPSKESLTYVYNPEVAELFGFTFDDSYEALVIE